MSNRDRRHRDVGEFESDGDHWVSIATACDKLLARLVKHHEMETAPAPPSEDTVLIKGRGS